MESRPASAPVWAAATAVTAAILFRADTAAETVPALIFLQFSEKIFFPSFPAAAEDFPDIAYTMRLDFLSAARGDEKTVNLNGKNINVKIPAGTTDGQTLRLKGLGQPSPNGGSAGDVLITLNVDRHPYFTAEGANILMELPITMKEAVLGAKVTVPTITGNVIVNIPPYASSGEKLRLKGKGIKTKSTAGDEIITLKIISPKTANAELEKALQTMPDEKVRSF